MVRKHTLNVLGGWTEEKLLEWAKNRVKKIQLLLHSKINLFQIVNIYSIYYQLLNLEQLTKN